MEYIKGFTFGWMSRRGAFSTEEAKQSLRSMKNRTSSEYVIIALAALQDTAQSTNIDFIGSHIVGDKELTDMIEYAQTLGLKVILKPTVNVKDGTWRAHINFFDLDVPCEPKWKDWFKSYRDYQLHYAEIASETNCEMLIIGCEMVQTERREQEWRGLIQEIRRTYSGLITYNTDKYQEGNVKWWDAVDVISSGGYYPIHTWEEELQRIETVVKPYGKPFFFAEAGCPSRNGSSHVPNNWSLEGAVSVEEQEAYYKTMFEKTKEKSWIKGFGLWDWSAQLYDERKASLDSGYGVYGKPAEKVIQHFYRTM